MIRNKSVLPTRTCDALIMGKKGNYDYRYTGQISVDSDHQIIVGEHLSKNANDKQEVEAALNEIVLFLACPVFPFLEERT